MQALSADLDHPRRKANDLCASVLARLQAGESGPLIDMVSEAVAASGGANEALLERLLDGAESTSTEWAALQNEVARNMQAMTALRERTRGVFERLQSLIELALNAVPDPTATGKTASPVARSRCPMPELAGAMASRPSPDAAAAPIDVLAPETLALRAYVLRPFELYVNDRGVERWPHCKSKSLFKFLLLHRDCPVAKDVLMDVFWHDAEGDAARNNLNVAMHRLRGALRPFAAKFPVVVFEDGRYMLNARMKIWTDADAYRAHLHRAREYARQGRMQEAMVEHEACVALYLNGLLPDNHNDEWVVLLRQELRDSYLSVLDWLSRYHLERQDHVASTAACARILAIDACNEKAHRLLMRSYARLGQPQLAQMQYRACVQTLSRELGMTPSVETTALYRQVAQRNAV
jgi:DNA-binding SARP family transcriptional activator